MQRIKTMHCIGDLRRQRATVSVFFKNLFDTCISLLSLVQME